VSLCAVLRRDAVGMLLETASAGMLFDRALRAAMMCEMETNKESVKVFASQSLHYTLQTDSS
jgi:hypothetical protein